MTTDQEAALSELKFEFTKMGMVISQDRGFDFSYEYRGHAGEMYLERLVERYLRLNEQQRRQLVTQLFASFFDGPDQAGGATTR